MRGFLTCIFACLASAVLAQDVVVIGEIHDNPAHHAEQARRVASINPNAIVFEMLTADQAQRVTSKLLDDETALEAVLEWNASGWPDFKMYYPIFAAAPQAMIYGAAVPRQAAGAAMNGDFGGLSQEQAMFYGLNVPLTADQQAAREALQMAAHCDALPEDMLSGMVSIQRLRDTVLAKTSLEAFRANGGPIVVITGNGHARKDWGMPAILSFVAPELDIFVIGQTEDGAPLQGGFDEVISADPVDRSDPCETFR